MTNPDPFAAAIATELRAELGRQNRSRRWLAERAGHSHVTVSRWLAEGHMPLGALYELCHALNISPTALIATVERQQQQVNPVPHPRRRASDLVAA